MMVVLLCLGSSLTEVVRRSASLCKYSHISLPPEVLVMVFPTIAFGSAHLFSVLLGSSKNSVKRRVEY